MSLFHASVGLLPGVFHSCPHSASGDFLTWCETPIHRLRLTCVFLLYFSLWPMHSMHRGLMIYGVSILVGVWSVALWLYTVWTMRCLPAWSAWHAYGCIKGQTDRPTDRPIASTKAARWCLSCLCFGSSVPCDASCHSRQMT